MIETVRNKTLQTLGSLGFDLEAIVSGTALRDFLKKLKECPDRFSADAPSIPELTMEFGIAYNGVKILFPIPLENYMDLLRDDKRYSQFSLSIRKDKLSQPKENLIQISSPEVPVRLGMEAHESYSGSRPHQRLQGECFQTRVRIESFERGVISTYRQIANEVIYLAERALERKIPLCIPITIGSRHLPRETLNPDGKTYSMPQITDPNFYRPIYYLPGIIMVTTSHRRM